MSSDESNCTHISTVSNQDGNKEKLKSHKSEQWEINLIGNFILDLYHRSKIAGSNDWRVEKKDMRKEYPNFINKELRKRMKDLNGTDDIGTLLHRCGFLINTPRGSSFYKIKYSRLFEYRNHKVEELDKLKINSDARTDIKSDQNLLNLLENKSEILLEDNYEVNESDDKILLEYQATTMLQRKENYYLTNMSCCICQEDFATMENYEEHVQLHGDDTDFEFLTKMSKFEAPIFTLSYRLCKNSHYFCFEFETKSNDLVIEKIIIVQSRSFYYVHNMRVPYKCPENGIGRFFVDSHLFTIHVEQPIVLICHLEISPETRIIEQHHFMRSNNFPTVNFFVNPYRLPNNKLFKQKFKMADYFPPKEIQDALKDDFYYSSLMKTSNEFRDYVRCGKTLQPQTIATSLNILLQIEDMDTIQQYIGLTQKNIKIRSYGDEYSFQLKPKQRVFIEHILSAYDEVVLTTRTDIFDKTEDIMKLMLQNKSDIFRMKNTFVGIIEAINTGRISFKCQQKINLNATYTVICRPSRLCFRYLYRTLELLPTNMDFLKKFLFPTKLESKPLPSINLNLYNKTICFEQLQAVRNIAKGPRNDATYIIFGPPGTGKTTTLVEGILQILKRPNTKILVTASSNSACDEVALRLCRYLKQIDMNRSMVRIYARSCENRSETIDDELLDMSNMYNGQFYPDIEVLHEYRVVVCTLSVVAKLTTGKFGRQECGTPVYTHLFIDEVAATTEADALLAMTTILSAKACLIIAGDHKQLGPILKSKRAQELGLDVSLMDRLMERECYRVDVDTGDYDRTIQTRLIHNYRSHPAIVNLYSGLYYNHSLESFAQKEDVALCEVWYRARNKQYPIMFHGITEPSRSDRQSYSLYNIAELNVVMDYVKDLMFFGIDGKSVKESDIGIISPYKKQVKRIQEELNLRKWFSIETGTVETFQGKEKEIVIVSFVRSGTTNLGFLDSPRRLNVTLSRSKSLLILIGNPQTLSLNSDFEYIIKECQRNNTFLAPSTARGEAKKQIIANQTKTRQLLTLLNENMQSLNVSDTNKQNNNETETSNRARRPCNNRARKNLRSRNWVEKNTRNINDKPANSEEDEAKSDDDDDDDDNKSTATVSTRQYTNSKNAAKTGKGQQQTNGPVAGAKSGKISKHYGKGKVKNITDSSSSEQNKSKIESIFAELPKVPTTQTQPNTRYTKEQLLQLQQQQMQLQQHHQQMQQQQHSNFYNNPNSNQMPHNSLNAVGFTNFSNISGIPNIPCTNTDATSSSNTTNNRRENTGIDAANKTIFKAKAKNSANESSSATRSEINMKSINNIGGGNNNSNKTNISKPYNMNTDSIASKYDCNKLSGDVTSYSKTKNTSGNKEVNTRLQSYKTNDNFSVKPHSSNAATQNMTENVANPGYLTETVVAKQPTTVAKQSPTNSRGKAFGTLTKNINSSTTVPTENVRPMEGNVKRTTTITNTGNLYEIHNKITVGSTNTSTRSSNILTTPMPPCNENTNRRFQYLPTNYSIRPEVGTDATANLSRRNRHSSNAAIENVTYSKIRTKADDKCVIA